MIGVYLGLMGVAGCLAYLTNKTIQLEETRNRYSFGLTMLILAMFGVVGASVVSGQFERMEALGAGILGVALQLFLFFVLIVDIKLKERPETLNRKKQENFDTNYNNTIESLSNDPEQSLKSMLNTHPNLRKKDIQSGAVKVFKDFIEQRQFTKAAKLLDYYDIDEYGLLTIARKLDSNRQTGKLALKVETFKISLLDEETAYEKLPCNWQKIHTYLAPLEDEIEQADILDSGNIYITDQRIFFVGKKGSETVYLNGIAYMDHKEDALQFFRDEGLSEIFAFPTPHHATYARLVIEELMGRQG